MQTTPYTIIGAMKRIITLVAPLLIALQWASCAEQQGQTGPVFDKEGHKISYRYPDGAHDFYFYDTAWRMLKFVSRDGDTTTYGYLPDGSIVTLKPDGSGATTLK